MNFLCFATIWFIFPGFHLGVWSQTIQIFDLVTLEVLGRPNINTTQDILFYKRFVLDTADKYA